MEQKRASKRFWTKEEIQEEAKKYPTRSEFAMGNRSAYKKAHREGWLDEICSNMNRPTKPKGYWTKDRIFEHAKKYTSITEFAKNEPSAYRVTFHHGWIDELHLIFGRQNLYYTKEECRSEALKYKSREAFKNYAPQHYDCAYRYGILTEICSHMVGSSNNRFVYVFEFEDHHAYIGLSCFPRKRHKQHLTERNSTVFKHIKETGSNYIFKVLTDTSVKDAVQQEISWLKKYKDNGWILLNKERDELANDGSPKYTVEYCKRIASRYSRRSSFQKGSHLIYNYAFRHGFLDEICKHMDRVSVIQHWTKERCQEEANKYKTRKDFQKKCRGAYAAAYRNKWLDDICTHMERPIPHNLYWTAERCAEEALKYMTRRDFLKASPGAYNAALKNGWIAEICSHMERAAKPAGYWTKERCIKEARKNESFSQFRKNCASAYAIAWRNGWLDEIHDKLKED